MMVMMRKEAYDADGFVSQVNVPLSLAVAMQSKKDENKLLHKAHYSTDVLDPERGIDMSLNCVANFVHHLLFHHEKRILHTMLMHSAVTRTVGISETQSSRQRRPA